MLASVANMLCADSGKGANDVTYFNPYVSVGADLHFFGSRDGIKYKMGPSAAVEFGISYDAWRVGLEVAYRQSKIKNVKNCIEKKLTGTDGEVPDKNKLLVILGEKDPANDNRFLAYLYKLDKISAFSGMITLAYDYAVTEQWSVYAEVGAGVANVAYEVPQVTLFTDLNTQNATVLNQEIAGLTKANYEKKVYKGKHNRSQNVFAWKAGLGGALELTENVKVMLGWNIFNTAKVKFVDGKKIKAPFGNEIKLRLLYSF